MAIDMAMKEYHSYITEELPTNDNDPYHLWRVLIVDRWCASDLLEMSRWCEENIDSNSWQGWQQGLQSFWLFRHLDDLVHFQLVWC